MSLFGSLTGSTQRRDLNRGAANAQGRFDAAERTYGDQYNTAAGRYAPYAESGQAANRLYGNFLGLNGQDAQRTAFAGYQEGPYSGAMRDNIEREVGRAANARGFGGSGREMQELYSRNAGLYDSQMRDYLNRLQGMQGQGLGVANALSSLDMGYGDRMGQLAGQRAGIDTQLASAIAGTRSMGWQNALSLLSPIMAAATPGAAGVSAGGNIIGGLGGLFGGGNSFSSIPNHPMMAGVPRRSQY